MEYTEGYEVVVRTIKIKKRLEKFYVSNEDQDLVFALYIDIDDKVHFYYCTLDVDRYEMLEQQFFKGFTPFREEEEHVK